MRDDGKDAPGGKDAKDALEIAVQVLDTEARAILGLIPQLSDTFPSAVTLLLSCTGRVIVTGMGKSGIISHKIAATLSSTGTSSFFLHPAEAIHGDLGAVRAEDVVVALSHSGETEELIRLVEAIRRIGARLIALTGNLESTLGQAADIALSCHVAAEACPMNLAPTASTTAALALGDALALALSQRKGFRAEEFADRHPGGKLGKKLMRVDALMHVADAVPMVPGDAPMPLVIHEMSSKRLGMTCVVDSERHLLGIVTDGDLRRHMTPGSALLDQQAHDVMTRQPVTITKGMLAVEAIRLMEQRKITALVVVDDSLRVEGVVHLHDLMRAGAV
ncbi:MAG TPA: KpsF/GutQ family sugar-phosphate isomerase [Vicinamibacterales bacterium]|nr:KpsF/GutQ family sugar-phosphate isomerase [Vicinamibacterales bacterium]